jgi:hypothetical protein
VHQTEAVKHAWAFMQMAAVRKPHTCARLLSHSHTVPYAMPIHRHAVLRMPCALQHQTALQHSSAPCAKQRGLVLTRMPLHRWPQMNVEPAPRA